MTASENLRATIATALPSFQPLPRIGMPDDVADAARFVNSQDVAVDGGIIAGRPFSARLANRAELARAARAAG